MDLALRHGETEWTRAPVFRVGARDRDAFAALFERFAPRVKSYMLKLGATPAAAEELAQDTLLAVWRKAECFAPARAGAAAWIFTIARNLRIDSARRDRIFRVLDGEPREEASEEPGPDAVLSASERAGRT